MTKEQLDLGKQWVYVEERDIAEDRVLWREIEDLGLPEQLLDVHVHSGLSRHIGTIPLERLKKIKTLNNRTSYSLPMIRHLHQSVFQGRHVDFVAFPFPYLETQIEPANKYLIRNKKGGERVLILADPANPGRTISSLNQNSSLVHGVKAYYDQVLTEDTIDPENVSIFDYFPREILEHLNKLGAVIMLHVPRKGGLSHPQTLAEVVGIANDFSDIKIILAHMGRCYFPSEMRAAISEIAQYQNIFFESSMVDIEETFEEAINGVGVKRIMLGTDLPLSMVRFLRSFEDGEPKLLSKQETYALRIDNKPDIAIGTNVLYMTRALLIACSRMGLSNRDKDDIFYNNAKRLFQN